jgi:hypothetical protein
MLVDGDAPVGGIDGELGGSVPGFAMAVASICGALAVAAGVPPDDAKAVPPVVVLPAGVVAVAGAFGDEAGSSALLRLGFAWPVTPSTVTVVSTDQSLPAYE